MLGAIAGDIIGSYYEFNNIKTTFFSLFNENSRFTDDTVLTVATMDSILSGKSYTVAYKEYYHQYPQAGYGERFGAWAKSKTNEPYGSLGNGSAMRVSPIGFWYNCKDKVLLEAKKSAEATHNHPEGIKGAQAIALAIFLAKTGSSKEDIINNIIKSFGYDLSESLDSIRTWYKFDVSCQGSVPQAIRVFYESESFEGAIRNAISIGGDSDTIACMTGAIAEAYYDGVPNHIKNKSFEILDESLIKVVKCFLKNSNIF